MIKSPVKVTVIPEPNVTFPAAWDDAIVKLAEPANVPVKLAISKEPALEEVSTVTVPEPELPSKMAASAEVGTGAPEDPPEVAAQFVVEDQLPVPPVTQ